MSQLPYRVSPDTVLKNCGLVPAGHSDRHRLLGGELVLAHNETTIHEMQDHVGRSVPGKATDLRFHVRNLGIASELLAQDRFCIRFAEHRARVERTGQEACEVVLLRSRVRARREKDVESHRRRPSTGFSTVMLSAPLRVVDR